MLQVISGFFAIWLVIGTGWLLAHFRVLASDAQLLLSRVSFFVGSPALMVTMMATADLKRIFAENLLVTAIATGVIGAVYLLLARFVLREPDGSRPALGHTVIGTFCAAYVNAGNMGLPIATYVLHDVTWIAPLILMQAGLLQPVGLAYLDIDAARRHGGPTSWRQNLVMPLRNPMTLGVLVGLAVNLTDTPIPGVLATPLDMLAGLAVPTMLIAFGISLRLAPLPGRGPAMNETLLVSLLKLVAQPLVAYVFARVMGLDGVTTRAVMVLAGLPTAQNVFSHAVRYDRSVPLARDVVFITSVCSIGTITAIAALVG